MGCRLLVNAIYSECCDSASRNSRIILSASSGPGTGPPTSWDLGLRTPGCEPEVPGTSPGSELDTADAGRQKKPIMLIVHVHVHVKPDRVEAFEQATLVNAQASLQEPGIARFDLLQQQDDPSRFVLVEAYRTPEAPARHKETSHYAVWRDAVAPWMAEPRTSVKFINVAPGDSGW